MFDWLFGKEERHHGLTLDQFRKRVWQPLHVEFEVERAELAFCAKYDFLFGNGCDGGARSHWRTCWTGKFPEEYKPDD